MNRLVKWLILANCFLVIPMTLVITPMMMDKITNIYDTSTWSKEAQSQMQETSLRWTYMLYIIPPLGTNFMIVLMYFIYGYNKPVQKSNSDDPYADWTPEWREYKLKCDSIDKKNKEDSEAILKKYEAMPDIKQRKGDSV